MLREFRDFLLRGNLLALAVAVVIGAAFNSVVSSLVKDLITPLIAAIGGKPNFDSLYFTVNHSKFFYGSFINAVISFIVVAAVVFFLVFKPVNHVMKRMGMVSDKEETLRQCPECLSKVPEEATRSAFCAIPLTPVAPATEG